MNFIEKKKKNMGLVPIIPRYNVDKGNSRSTFHIFNSNEALGVWQISLFTSGSAPTPKFILTLGDNNNTNITLQILDHHGTVVSNEVLAPFVLTHDSYYNLDICDNLLCLSTFSFIVSSGSVSSTISSTSAPATSNSGPIFCKELKGLNEITSIEAGNNGFANVFGEINAVTTVPGCTYESHHKHKSCNGFNQQNVQICIGVLAAVAFIFLILFVIFASLYYSNEGRSTYYV